MTDNKQEAIRNYLNVLYGEYIGSSVFDRLNELLNKFQQSTGRTFTEKESLFDEGDIILITYGDQIRKPGEAPLKTLLNFYEKNLGDIINTIHILPFFPYSSDDGFSVTDYHAVNPQLGSWQDIIRFQTNGIKTMFDAVINHISAHSDWFQGFLHNDPKYGNYFITVDPKADLSMVTRPRELPLITPFNTASGEKFVWTTFSADQIDLNYKNPDTLLDVIDVLLDYIDHGADLIRLDAIAYLWKEIGTSCIHLPQTHTVVKLFRTIIDLVAPGVLLITETNVPHEENISYFGDGNNEAHLVYQFPLPPLAAHALITGNASYLTFWAKSLQPPSMYSSFFNFTASHDGIGVRPAAGILPESELKILVEQTRANGGRISSKTNSDGSSSPYELNITYFDLLNSPLNLVPQSIQVKRFLVSQAIMLALSGIPGIYIHNLLGSRNFEEGVINSGHARSINREKLDLALLDSELGDSPSLRHAVFSGYENLLSHRRNEKAFHPNGGQKILDVNKYAFCMMRTSPDGKECVLALHNVSNKHLTLNLKPEQLKIVDHGYLQDILTDKTFSIQPEICIELSAYEILWLKFKVSA